MDVLLLEKEMEKLTNAIIHLIDNSPIENRAIILGCLETVRIYVMVDGLKATGDIK